MNENSISLNKHISNSGFCSRREADKLIDAGRVTINGTRGKTGNRVEEGDVVAIDGEELQPKPKTVYIAFNKPVGVVCTTDSKIADNIISVIQHEQRLFPIGRLDKESEGLIFLTNDGDIVNKILRAGNQHEKEYYVSVNRPVTSKFIREMSEGVEVLGKLTRKCEVEALNKNTFRITLVQGLNRQIRRMCKELGYSVTALQRTRIMNVNLGKLKIGRWRKLTKVEMKGINEMIATSSKTEEASPKRKNRKFPKQRKRPGGPQPGQGKKQTNSGKRTPTKTGGKKQTDSEKRFSTRTSGKKQTTNEKRTTTKKSDKTQSFKKFRANRKKR